MAELNFGKYAIIDVVEHHFEKEPEWVWKIKPPASGDELAMSKFLVQNRVEVDNTGTRREFPPTYTEIAYREIALCFGGTTIQKPNGDLILKDDARIEQIEAMLRKMPHSMVMEIWGAIADSVPGWGPQRPLASSSPTQPDTEETE